MLPVHSDTIRLFLHVTAATIWVGGQVTLAALVPALRRAGGPDITRTAARSFQFVAWPAFAVLLATGVWNLAAVHLSDQSGEYLTTVVVKLLLVAISGAGALLHTTYARERPALGGMAAGIGLLAALGATFLGLLLTTG